MGNVFDKSGRGNKNIHFMFNNCFPKIAQFIMSKNVVETEGPQMTSQHGAYALHHGLARLHALTRMHTPTRLGTHMHTRATCTHRPISNTYCFSTVILIRKRASILRYTYIAPPVWDGNVVAIKTHCYFKMLKMFLLSTDGYTNCICMLGGEHNVHVELLT